MAFAPTEVPFVKVGRAGDDETQSISVHPDASIVAACCEGTLQLVTLPGMKKGGKSKDHGRQAVFSPDGSLLVATGSTSVAVLDPKKGALSRVIFSGEYSVNQLAFSPDGKQIVVGEAKRALVFDVASGKQSLEFPVFDRTVKHVAWSRDGRNIATRSWQDAAVFDGSTGERLAVLEGLDSDHGDIVFAADGSVITAIDAATVGVWKSGSWKEPARRIPTGQRAKCIAVGKTHVALQDRGAITILGADYEHVDSLKVDDEISSLAFSSDDSLLFAGIGPSLFAWTSGPAKTPKVEPPEIKVKLAAAREAKRDVDVTKVAWLANLGGPIPAAAKVQPLKKLEEWPGTDDEGVAAFLRFIQTLEDDLGTAARLKGVTLPAHGEGAYGTVFAAASKRVPYDAKRDWAAPPNAAPLVVATIATIVERYRKLDWPLPPTIETLWAWCLDGRWPCGFDHAPGKAAVRLLVL